MYACVCLGKKRSKVKKRWRKGDRKRIEITREKQKEKNSFDCVPQLISKKAIFLSHHWSTEKGDKKGNAI